MELSDERIRLLRIEAGKDKNGVERSLTDLNKLAKLAYRQGIESVRLHQLRIWELCEVIVALEEQKSRLKNYQTCLSELQEVFLDEIVSRCVPIPPAPKGAGILGD